MRDGTDAISVSHSVSTGDDPFRIDLHGFALARRVLTEDSLAQLAESIGACSGPGRRGVSSIAAVAHLAQSEALLEIIRPHMTDAPRLVRALYFNKSLDANWFVSWHQDLTLAVRCQKDVPGFGPWSVKDGIPHVQPPANLLGRMLAVRLHFDDADESNGALRVVPGSHRFGRLSAAEIERIRSDLGEVTCSASAGDALLMRPLLLHASGRSTNARPRRVLHLEYADFALPSGLEWHEAV